MKKYLASLVVLLSAALTANATPPTKRDLDEIKTVTELAARQKFMKTEDPVSLGKDTYAVTVKVSDKVCRSTVQPNPNEKASFATS